MWRGSGGQIGQLASHLLQQRSEFESHRSQQYFIVENCLKITKSMKKEAGNNGPFKKVGAIKKVLILSIFDIIIESYCGINKLSSFQLMRICYVKFSRKGCFVQPV